MQVFIYSLNIIIFDCSNSIIHYGTKQGKTTCITAYENVENKSLLIRQKLKKNRSIKANSVQYI